MNSLLTYVQEAQPRQHAQLELPSFPVVVLEPQLVRLVQPVLLLATVRPQQRLQVARLLKVPVPDRLLLLALVSLLLLLVAPLLSEFHVPFL
jgi:hypothetical protein